MAGHGILAVVHHGCTAFTHLVVSGPGRGRLVNVDLDGFPAPYVLEDKDFLAWYERWLAELLAGCDVVDFGEKLPGGEGTLLAILAEDPSPRRPDRSRCCAKSARRPPAPSLLPRPTRSTRLRIYGVAPPSRELAALPPTTSVRRTATRALLEQLLAGTDPAVRRQGVQTAERRDERRLPLPCAGERPSKTTRPLRRVLPAWT
ncbi:hypothetical protein Amsp01_028720 [Amycolatopsis sp. NBRC 101858]|uniref:hypothetical protein n=1 Tax=Amycolatopsis sp. NBRC 101858 TaxID=3032200 RepID=UPI0024A264C5|nr:hypothetical protein [Amycolatopsis sp. NBRC 101858]GLY36848.1 hypothetical protein Amsp01_028720 [Amycolatopsis sp. NBRC 101858]